MSDAIVILGPTASGKSALALNLAKHIKSEIISLDSALIYKGMDIGTAKPSKEELAICPHHLIDIIDVDESYSAANFREDCIRLVSEIKNRGATPIICGGTMMYYKALVDGLSPLPQTDEITRAHVQALGDSKGWVYVHSLLEDIDPILYTKLAPNDKQRVSRAYEVYLMTGKSMSSFFKDKGDKCPFSREEFVLLPLNNDRTNLRVTIRKRFLKMIEMGFIDEVKSLLERYSLNLNMPSMRCVGYRQAFEYLNKVYSFDEMIEKSVNATSQLAKHQMTWLRGSLFASRTILDIENEDNLNIVLQKLNC